jgi:hypothetical protein
MSNEVLGDDIVKDFEDDVVELTTIEEDESVCAEKDKKKATSVGRLQLFGNILMSFVVRRVRS